ncbi:MAG: nitroreductase family protein [Anaerolineaceae bacterium]
METIEAITGRKTIRDFQDRELEPEVIKIIITAGMAAPSNNHMRDWHFVILKDHARRCELLDRVIKPVSRKGALGIINRWQLTDELQREMYLDGIPRQYQMLANAGCLILPFYRQETPLLKPKAMFDLNPFASIWCCIENMLVAASDEGVFGVIRIPFEPELKIIYDFLAVPEGYVMPCFLALGYPAEDAKRARQVDIKLEDRMHMNRW